MRPTSIKFYFSFARFARLELPVVWFWNRQERAWKYRYRFQIHGMEIQMIISGQPQFDLKIASFEFIFFKSSRLMGYIPVSNNFPSSILDSSMTRIVRETS